MLETVIPRPQARPRAEGPLALGLAALRRGRDPLLDALGGLRGLLRAHRVLWRASGGTLWVHDASGGRRAQVLPREIPRRWLWGGERELAARELARDPRAVGEGLRHAALRRTATGGSLWIEGRERLALEELEAPGLLVGLGALEEIAQERLERPRRALLEARGEAAAGVAHDLRNQLSLALLELERARSLGIDAGTACGPALERARSLCEDFLQDGHGKRREGIERWMSEEVRGALALAGRGDEVSVYCRHQLSGSPVADESAVRRVLHNLVLNAIAASPKGSAVHVELREPGPPGHLALVVRDQGQGMSAADRERLFRAGESRGGTGFGTSSLRACVERLGGELRIDSTPGHGTRVTVSWPGELE